MKEVWRNIPGFPSHQASSLGRVRRSLPGKGYPAGYVVKQKQRESGYMIVSLSAKKHFVHKLVCMAFHGEPESGLEVSHENGNKADNRAINLAWRSPKANNAMKRVHGTLPLGEMCNASRLPGNQIITIRSAYRLGMGTQESIGAFFGVSRATIGDIITRRTWRHL